MLVFISKADLSEDCGGKTVKDVLSAQLEEALSCRCLVLDTWCDGVFWVDDLHPWECKVLYHSMEGGSV